MKKYNIKSVSDKLIKRMWKGNNMNIKISAFKKLSDVNNPYNRDVFKCLERIRSGSSKDKN